jgi:exonuclease SbcD
MLHFADIHIGMENYGRTDPHTGLSSRVMDFLHRMDDMIEFSLEQDVDLVVFAGDAFKTRTPNPTYQREFAHRVLDLAAHCPVVLLVGNHDTPTNTQRASSIEVFETLRVPNVHVGMDYEVLQLETKSGPVQVGTAPYPVRSRLLVEERERTSGLSIAQLDVMLQDQLHKELATMAEQVSQSDVPRVLAGHFTIHGAVLGSERQVMLGRDVMALLSSVADPAWDYVAMGHIHKHQNMTLNTEGMPPVVYSGSLERIDFGEEGDDKGFCWVELERGSTHWQFIELKNVRPFVTLRVDTRKAANPTQAVINEINRHDLQDAIVRILIKSDPESDSALQAKAIEDAVIGQRANIIAAIHRQVERPERTRLGSNPEGLTAMELLERYLDTREVPADQINKLMDAAEDIFRQVDDSF